MIAVGQKLMCCVILANTRSVILQTRNIADGHPRIVSLM